MARMALILEDNDGVRRVRQIFDPVPSLAPGVLDQCQTVAVEVVEGWIDDPVHGLIPPKPADVPGVHIWNGTAWELDAAATDQDKDNRAAARLNTPFNKGLVDLLWDLETRMRAAGQTSAIAEIAAAADKATYKVECKGIVKGYET